MKKMLPLINTGSAGMNRNLSQRWIESLIGKRSTSRTTEFLLPEGEG